MARPSHSATSTSTAKQEGKPFLFLGPAPDKGVGLLRFVATQRLVNRFLAWDCEPQEQQELQKQGIRVSTTSLLRDVFGFDAFRPGQEEIVDAVSDVPSGAFPVVALP